jgi:hypothetical protein
MNFYSLITCHEEINWTPNSKDYEGRIYSVKVVNSDDKRAFSWDILPASDLCPSQKGA